MYYVIQTKIGNEQKVINKVALLSGKMHDYDLFIPKRKMIRKIHGEYKSVIENCFPGYIFSDTEAPQDLYRDLSRINEFSKLLGREGLTYNFSPLNENESRTIDILYGKSNDRITNLSLIEIREGNVVRILSGPLKTMKGVIRHMNFHKRKVIVEIQLLNRSINVAVGIDIITTETRH